MTSFFVFAFFLGMPYFFFFFKKKNAYFCIKIVNTIKIFQLHMIHIKFGNLLQ